MIRAQSLSKRFGHVEAVRDVSFEIEAGRVVGFLGPNGAGKSTSMRMLTGYLAPDNGAVHIAGHAMADEPLAARAQLGYLPEHTPLYGGMRVDDYLDHVGRLRGLARPERRSALGRVAARVGLHGMLRRRVRTLSKGYRQRVGLAQALIGDPPVLVLDEPTSGLDPVEVGRMRELVRELGQDKTLLLSSHVLSEIEALCSRVLILAGGQLVADGELDELCRSSAGAGGRVRLSLEARAGRAELQSLLEACPAIDSFALAEGARPGVLEARLVAVEGRGPEDTAAAVAERVVRGGCELLRLEPERRSLHEVFLELTSGAPSEAERDA